MPGNAAKQGRGKGTRVLGWLQKLMGREDDTLAASLYDAVIDGARQPHWYEAGGVPDTIDGRFDMVAAILSLVLLRLESEPRANAASIRLTERFVTDMDAQLREQGVGDIGVGKHIGKMMGMLGGRLGAYRDGLAAGDLQVALERNLYRGRAAGRCGAGVYAGGVVRAARGTGRDSGRGADRRTFAVSAPEFSRPERIDTIGAGEREVTIIADATERAALAVRFGLMAVDRLEAVFRVKRDAAGIVARGRVSAAVVQACSVTDDPLPVTVAEDVALRFFTEREAAAEDEVELDLEALDTMPYDGSAIDLGEAAAETMALALDPFPRGPNAAAALREAGVISEEEAKPAGALAGLKGLLGG